MAFFRIGNRYKLEVERAQIVPGNKPSRRMLRAKAKRQNSKFGMAQHKLWDEYARLAPRPGMHPKQRRDARMTRHGFGLVQPRR